MYKKKFIRNSGKFLVLIALTMIFVQTIDPKQAAAAYDGGRIIDNAVFLDARSMGKDQVQSFLASKGGQIATRSFVLNCDAAGNQAKQAYLSLGAPCGHSVPASHIIYYSAQVYGISPKVILATLQKEQSLITAVNPTDRQYSQAMGYACPTSGNCSDSSNFFWQIDNGTWVLRFHMERARGNNNWWYASSGWTCGTSKDYYKPNLYPNQNVDFYDEDGVYYRKLYIVNAATSSMYCYTPHTYNNPEGLYGRPPYGMVGRYYSGSYNFVLFFESWFGSTSANAYEARVVSQSPYPTIRNGETKLVSISYANQGFARWYDDTSVPSGGNPVHLAATNPMNRTSIFGANWPPGGRATRNFTKVFESDGVTLASNQHAVEPGQIAVFEFNLTADNGLANGSYREHFQPVLEGSPSWNMGGISWLDITVESPYKAAFHKQGAYPDIYTNDTASTYIEYKNIGTAYWYDDLTAAGNNTLPIRLAATYPINRSSFFSSTWPSGGRASQNFAIVYLSDGTTPSPYQHVARPGEIVRFEFNITARTNLQPGSYREHFQPIKEGPGNWSMGGLSWLDIKVKQTTNNAAFHSQSAYPNIKRGESFPSYLSYRNSGTTNWYDDTSAIPGISSIRLAATNPINRSSVFSYGWQSAGRPAIVFSKVYEADGTTLSPNQHVVRPSQIARFEFNLTAPWNIEHGSAREYFQPIVEGPGNWSMGGLSWLDITVSP